MGPKGHEPNFTLKPVADGVWIADAPTIPALSLPIPSRMTVVRLPDGGLWLHSPVEPRPSLVAEVRAEGAVRHLVAPNLAHHSWVAPWQEAAPEALAWAAPGARRRNRKVRWHADLGDAPPPDWAETIDQMVVRGSRVLKEVAFFHRPSRTLILTDLVENLERDRVPAWLGALARLGGVADPDGKAPPHLRAAFTDRRALRASVERLLAWEPERVLLAHGRWYDRDGAAELRRAFRWAF